MAHPESLMSPSDHSPSGPRTDRPQSSQAGVSAGPASASTPPVPVAPVLAALSGAVVLFLSALDPLRASAPWLLPALSAGSGALAGLAMLSVWRSRRHRPGLDDMAPTRPVLPVDAPAGPVCEAVVSRSQGEETDAARIALLEEALRETVRQSAERLRRQQIVAMDARADLAGAIVHDMNNALGAVSGYADFLVSDLPAGSPQADYASRVIAAVERVRPGLRRLVSATRVETIPLRLERADAVLDEAAALLRAMPVPPLGLTVQRDDGMPAAICNADVLARTLAGLAAEILAGGSAPRLGLRASAGDSAGAEGDDVVEGTDASSDGWRVRSLLTPHAGPHILFELRVEGLPLAADLLTTQLDPLLSARASYRRGQAGGGWAAGEPEDAGRWPPALMTARSHDGGLSLLSHPVQGTVVRLHIPAAPVPSVAPSPRDRAAPARPGHAGTPAYRILVVDADPASGDRFQAGLEQEGFEVSVCEDLRDALDVVTDEPGFFDVVVIGPGLSALPAGVALAVRMKGLRPDLPCVLYRAPGDAGAIPAASPAGSPTVSGALEPRAAAGGPADLLLPLPVDLPRLARGVAALAARSGGGAAGESR
ncbi:two-component hybrid sensor and regulator (plasmid) [Azospirillum sp. B510]|uniref:two-component hybrid sensor and regulator n=1 Tax=Azospirillum sp. (strain B510) TaxID=137722 RepID=UPI0001C4C614|nr:two-component hybrid sensor and regulator [Azospirillum sp. B510]BAI76008.1 two-component hybrid sensor and regulator [Azospirillum sp. B510]